MTEIVSLPVAFGAGLLSFLAPCTLALVPAYISYLAGFNLSGSEVASPRRMHQSAVVNTMLFTLGFTAVFVLLGASIGALSQVLASYGVWLNWIGGSFIILMGLVTLGLLRVPVLEQGWGPRFGGLRQLRYVGSFLVGAVFAIGWTPCVGPVLAAVFVLAGTSGSASQGALLLASYSAGMMLPFVVAGVTTGWTSNLLRTRGRLLQMANQVAGVLLIVLGTSIFTGLLPALSSRLALGA
ncbi:MAG: cytochrome c biogenesis protein CcdA [Dehalococcoidia bacterium]